MLGRRVHPWVYMVLIAPFGAMSGYLTVTVAWRLAKAGIPLAEIAALVAISFVPHTWKFLWAPIADTTLTRHTWYRIAGLLSAAGIAATGLIPPNRHDLALLTGVVLVSNCAVTFLGFSVESLMAYGTSQAGQGRAGGWFQAGNLGGNGLGGGLGLWLAQRLPHPGLAGVALGVLCALCVLALPLVPEPEASAHREGGLLRSLRDVVVDLWGVARSRGGLIALVLCFLPIGSGAASGLWSAVSHDWRASGDTVALVTGVLAGVLSAAGCLIGGWICDRMDRKIAYGAFGLMQAGCAVVMAFMPHSERMFVIFTSLYAVITGLTYAGFTAFVLEAMGLGAAATKYNAFASLSNMPILMMTYVDGQAHGRWGPSGMLITEAVCCTLGLVVFFTVRSAVTAWPAARVAPPPAA